ncbi:hypothetical protein CsSME_00047635 [Camellia sinensis var. sinensis]
MEAANLIISSSSSPINAKPVIEITQEEEAKHGLAGFGRACFPDNFIFGTASAAYQYEGAANEGGRGPSIWDTFTHQRPGKISDGSNADVGIDFYHQFKDDVKIIRKMGLDAFRFSISWSRVLPSGKLSGGVNKEGIKFYSNLIDELLVNGLKPFVTLFHWDLPQALEDEYGGFLSSQIVSDFCDYAELCFWEFGDRVKHWITLNEPVTFSQNGYVTGIHAPGRGSSSSLEPMNGDPATEPYLVSHNLLLAHAVAVQLYRQKFQECQKGVIGITLLSHWMVPQSNSSSDCNAAQRALDFMFGWYMEPLTRGDYPGSMRNIVRNRLPEFTETESEMVKGSFDFIGINYYTANYVADASSSSSLASHYSTTGKLSYATDPMVHYSTEQNGVSIGPKANSYWLHVHPQGFYDLLVYTKEKYNNPLIYITENGVDELNDVKLTIKEARVDKLRLSYHLHHLRYLLDAIRDGVNVKGYFQWSLLDNFEWHEGFSSRFGMIYVDYKDRYLTRYPKESALWFMNFLKKDA